MQGVYGKGIENYIADVTPDVGFEKPAGKFNATFPGYCVARVGLLHIC